MQRFLAYLQKYPLYPLLGLFVIAHCVSFFTPAVISWDGSVYAGMAKYLFSGGEMGVWEILRPVGFPTLLGLLWKLGLDPYLTARVIVLLSSLVSLFLVYKIGNRIREGVGVFAGYVLALTPLFFSFSSIPMTDVLSTTLALASVYAVLQAETQREYWLGGLLAGLAFLFRFPHGLVIVVSGIVVLARSIRTGEKWKEVFVSVLWLGFGFFALVVPFLIANTIAYGDPLLPLRAGAGIIAHNPILYRQHPLFYLSSMVRASYLYFFAVVPLALILVSKKYRTNQTLQAVMLYLFVYVGYFSITEHKEFRYSLAFLPMVAVIAGVGMSVIVSRIRFAWVRNLGIGVVLAVAVYGAIGAVRTASQKNDLVYEQIGLYFNAYEKERGKNARVLSAVPFISARSNALIIDTLYDDWRIVLPLYEKNKGDITHVLTDTCTLEIICKFDEGCTEGKKAFEEKMKNDAVLVQAGSVGSCRVMLYEVK